MRDGTWQLLVVLLLAATGCGAGVRSTEGDGDADTDTDLDCSAIPEDEARCASYGAGCDACNPDDGGDPSPGTACEYFCQCSTREFRPDFFGSYIGCRMSVSCRDQSHAAECCAAAALDLIEPSAAALEFTEACEARRDADCPDLSCEAARPAGEAYPFAAFSDGNLSEFAACLEEPDCSHVRGCIHRVFDGCPAK